VPATSYPTTALGHALQLLSADEHQLDGLIRSAAWVARCVGRGPLAPVGAGDLPALTGRTQQRSVVSGQVLFRAGQRPSGVWLVVAGRFELILSSRRRRAVVGTLGAGDVDGDIALLLDRPAPYSARAIEDGSCMYVSRANFEAVLADHPAIARRWMSSVAQRLVLGQARLVNLLGEPLVGQTARLLLDEAVDAVVRLPQRTLAAMLGVRRPSLNKVLKELERDGLIVIRYASIEIVDRIALTQLSR
jgi:CRP/FNR family transcriptional regulator, cAMP and macrophage regulator